MRGYKCLGLLLNAVGNEKWKIESPLPSGGVWELITAGEERRWSSLPFKTGLHREQHAHIQDTVMTEVRGQNMPLIDGSVHLPASDGWSHPVHQLTVGLTDPLCRQATEKETHSSANRKKMMQPVCLAKTQTVDNVHFSLCSYLHLWGCMSLICTVSYLLFPKVSVCSLCTSPSAHTAASSCLKEVSWFHVLAYRQSLGFSLCY